MRESSPAIFGNVPPRNRNFTGRDDILGCLRVRASDGSTVMTAVLPKKNVEGHGAAGGHGLGSVGKTAVTIEYAHRYSSDYDHVWWIPADQLPSVRGPLATLAAQLNVKAQSAAGTDVPIAAMLDALRPGEPYSRWLLIFDNADRPEDSEDLIPTVASPTVRRRRRAAELRPPCIHAGR